jgi:ABC-2 type transport system ATP-binding protein
MISIKVDGLKKSYKYYKKEAGLKSSFRNLFGRETLYKDAVKSISFEIEEGEVVGFIGPNGAGKTTTLKMLSGILYPSGGTASILGYTPWERKNEFKRQFSFVMGQKNQLWWDLPAIESMDLNKYIYQLDDKEFRKSVDELSELLNVKDILNVQVRRLSLGERMKMELITALLHKPRIVLLDEPTIGLDMISQRNLREFLKYYNKQFKTTILLTSHYMDDIENLCKRAIIINSGQIAYDGELASINEIFNKVKIMKLKFQEAVSDEVIGRFGRIRESDGRNIILEVDKGNMNLYAKQILDHLKPLDFSIEDVPLEDGISLIYQMEGAANEPVKQVH